MRSFVAVADVGVITDAARGLFITQSTLSRRIQQLEADLDVTLLHRSGHGVELTDAGRDVLIAARELIDRHDRLRASLRERDALGRGSIRVGGGATATSVLLTSCIAQFHAAYPALRLYVKEAGSRQIADDVAAGRLDLGVVTLPIDDSGIVLAPLVTDEIVLVAPIEHELSRRTVGPSDLDGHAIIGFESGTAIRTIIDASLMTAGVRVDIVAELRSIPAMLHLVSLTGIPAFVSRTSLSSVEGLTGVDVNGLKIVRQLALATRANGITTPAIEAFVALLIEVTRTATEYR